MEAAEFSVAWKASGDRLCEYPADAISASRLPESTKNFLREAGLPREAAPFLNFAPDTLDWLRQSYNGLDRFYALGSDGSGDPLVVDEEGVVWLINHEAPGHKTLVNSSVPALAECLLSYRNLVAEVTAGGGEDAFLDGRISRDGIEALSGSIETADGAAVQPGSFWREELNRLSTEAQGQ